MKGVSFPSIVSGPAAMLLSLMHQYEKSEWWTPDQLLEAQYGQLSLLADHALRTVPFHAERLLRAGFRSGEAMTPEIWKHLPVLTREEVRDHEGALKSSSCPSSFGAVSEVTSGGSTGVPVRVLKTALDALLWQAAHLREFLWHGIDFGREIANLRGMGVEEIKKNPGTFLDEPGVIAPEWGAPASLFWNTGRMGIVQPNDPLEVQAAYLMRRRPSYLIMRPSGLRLLLSHFREQGLSLDSLLSVWTMSEAVDEGLRGLCREVFGCPILNNYSCNETGYMAIQCPSGTNFHVVSESQLVEVIDPSGRLCGPGEIGRVVVTPLHNFAMPLLRYEVGDEAEVGEPCTCGRGLPSLKRIVGRLGDYVSLPSGDRKRVDVEHYRISAIRAVREFQLVQTTSDRVELRLVVARPLDGEELGKIDAVLKKSFEGLLEWSIVIVGALPRTPSGKLLQFRSELLNTS
jgi:phenylacetate-CoA ligase